MQRSKHMCFGVLHCREHTCAGARQSLDDRDRTFGDTSAAAFHNQFYKRHCTNILIFDNKIETLSTVPHVPIRHVDYIGTAAVGSQSIKHDCARCFAPIRFIHFPKERKHRL